MCETWRKHLEAPHHSTKISPPGTVRPPALLSLEAVCGTVCCLVSFLSPTAFSFHPLTLIYCSTIPVSNVLKIIRIFRFAESFDQCLEWNIESLRPVGEQITAFKGSSGGICGYCKDGEHCSLAFDSTDVLCYACPFGKDACDGSTFCLNGANPTEAAGCTTCPNGSFMVNGTCRTCPEWAKYTYIVALLFAAFVCWLVYQNSGGDVDMSTLTISATHFQVTALYFTFALRYTKLVIDVLKWPFAYVVWLPEATLNHHGSFFLIRFPPICCLRACTHNTQRLSIQHQDIRV